ncbi:unnamed protein product, partial [Heligmosomoides polygyrus]
SYKSNFSSARSTPNREAPGESASYCIFIARPCILVYKSPISEELAFNLSIKRLVDIGYPREILGRQYRSNFVARNAWFDKRLGNLLKTDEHCNILTAFHGFTKREIRQQYPNKHVALEESRIFVLNTVFNVPEALLLASLVDYFENQSTSYEKIGYKKKDTQQTILYSTIFEDCRRTIDWIHTVGDYKRIVCGNLQDYIAQDERAVAMMNVLSRSGKKLFLLTNSPWIYTDILMSFVMGSEWQQLFDVVIVDGNKPKWFLQDIPFKEVRSVTGKCLVGTHCGPFRKGDVYSAGCAAVFIQRMRLAGKDILYVGDHIFGDVLKSKKTGGWRTLLIVPELERELRVRNLKLTEDMEEKYSSMGSMMRCGWRLTHFAAQLKKFVFHRDTCSYADIYTSNAYNLADYSPSFYFNSPIHLLPHEEKFMLSFEHAEEKKESTEEVCCAFKSNRFSNYIMLL